MNKVELTGKALNVYESNTGALVVKILVLHEHKIGKERTSCESVFNVVMTDADKIPLTSVRTGDWVRVTGHIKADVAITSGGHDRRKVMVYADDIEQDIRSGFNDRY